MPETVGDNVRSGSPALLAIADRAIRALQGRPRADVIGQAGLSKNTVQRILRGEPVKRATLIALADACGVRAEWLIDGDGQRAADAPPDRPPPTDQAIEKLNLSSSLDQVRLGAAMRIAHRGHPSPTTPEEWTHAARDIAEIYDLLGEQLSSASPDQPS